MARELIDRSPAEDRAAIVLPALGGHDITDSRLEESAGLAEALGVTLVFADRVNVREPNPARLLGSGQLEALQRRLEAEAVTLLILDASVTPIQQRNLENLLKIKVIDRTGLILEIFGLRARTAEGRLQVEMARSLYERSRLVRTWTHLERQRGGFGFLGGPGETQLEADRRMLDKRIAGFRRDLDAVRRTRRLQREGRARRGTPIVALVGYTNAGKSTLFNTLTRADVLAADMPFATLDPTAREMQTSSGRSVTLIDTVGFITDLPTHPVAAFRATLEEAIEADLLVHVRDIAHPESEAQAVDVHTILEQLEDEAGVDRPPVIEAWNKSDLLGDAQRRLLKTRAEQSDTPVVMVSATTGEGVKDILAAIDLELFSLRRAVTIGLEATHGALRSWLHGHAAVVREATGEAGDMQLDVRMSDLDLARFRKLASGQNGVSIVDSAPPPPDD